LAAVVDGLRLESGTLHNDDYAEEEEKEEESAKSRRERDAAATAVAARAVARLLRSLSFRLRGGLALALESLRGGPPAAKERVETALRLLGHVVAEEGCCFGSGFGSDGEKKGDDGGRSSSLDSFAAAILGVLDSPAASPGEVEACLALLREVAARDDDERGEKGSSAPPPPPPPSPASSSSASVVAALVRAGIVPRLLERISDLPPVRGQEEAEAESDAKKKKKDGEGEEDEEEEEREGGGDERRKEKRKQRRRRPPRYPEERADAVAVLANALHRRAYVAESLLRCEGGAELLLAQCGAVGAEEAGEGEWRPRRRGEGEAEEGGATRGNKDSSSPPPSSRNPLPPTVGAFAREWALWALRNLTESSEEARRLLSDLRPVRAVPSEELERAGLRLELDEGSGKFELKKIGDGAGESG